MWDVLVYFYERSDVPGAYLQTPSILQKSWTIVHWILLSWINCCVKPRSVYITFCFYGTFPTGMGIISSGNFKKNV